VPEEELDLLKFASGFMAQTCAAATQIVRRQMIYASIAGTSFHDGVRQLGRKLGNWLTHKDSAFATRTPYDRRAPSRFNVCG
jgi:hypothetical protein